nr:immunoglobulin light chain junction region [Macaca mulatta]MPN91981.1 immunoglobulin light chain junction region [Macaca mulatta]MPN93531.1 immunoglobulin light chain junction region [Macaca mulatta]MPN93728.1 immunoglobulin light chain junction region [Macaca mulatta]MPN94392.1 immunoglobulin light chain junction region [Macaca mulatta]
CQQNSDWPQHSF